jgi:hypothetical protein
MKTDFKKEFDDLFGLVSEREKRRNDFRLERQALRIKQALSKLKETSPADRSKKNPKNHFYGVVGEYTILK